MTETAGTSPATPVGKSAGAKTPAKPQKQKQEQERQARLARKLERADDLDHLLLWVRTEDAQVLRGMLYAFDRACAKVRAITASLELPLAEGQAALAKAQIWLDQLEGVAYSGGARTTLTLFPGTAGDGAPELPKTLQEKQALRAYRRAIAGQYGVDFFLPRSHEGRRLALALTALDAELIRARAVESLEDTGALLAQVGRLIREGHELTTWLAQLTRVSYEPHPLLKRALKAERSRSTVERIVEEAAVAGSMAAKEAAR